METRFAALDGGAAGASGDRPAGARGQKSAAAAMSARASHANRARFFLAGLWAEAPDFFVFLGMDLRGHSTAKRDREKEKGERESSAECGMGDWADGART